MLTGGAFSAPTAGERAARIRTWLDSEPPSEQLSEVFKELSHRDKGAARPVKDKLDDRRRARNQEALAQEWADRARAPGGPTRSSPWPPAAAISRARRALACPRSHSRRYTPG